MGQLLFLRSIGKRMGAALVQKSKSVARLEALEIRYSTAHHDLMATVSLLDEISAKLEQMSLEYPGCMPRASFDASRSDLLFQIEQVKERVADLKASREHEAM